MTETPYNPDSLRAAFSDPLRYVLPPGSMTLEPERTEVGVGITSFDQLNTDFSVKTSYDFSGKVNVDEVRDRLGVEIEREGFETVGGFLLSYLGRMPYVGERIEIGELRFEVLEVERRRITKRCGVT